MPLDEEIDDYVDDVMAELDEDDDSDESVSGLVEVGAIDEVGARGLRGMRGSVRMRAIRKLLRKKMRYAQQENIPRGARGLPSPPFGRSERSTERRAPLGFIEEGSGENFFTLPGVVGATTTMVAKVSREAHADRLLIVPSAAGAVLQAIKVGDEEQLLASGAPVELYSTAALTDAVPDNFSPLGPALDFVVTLRNTTVDPITGTIGIKASVKR